MPSRGEWDHRAHVPAPLHALIMSHRFLLYGQDWLSIAGLTALETKGRVIEDFIDGLWFREEVPSVQYMPAPVSGLHCSLRFGRASMRLVERIAELCNVQSSTKILDIGSGDGYVAA